MMAALRPEDLPEDLRHLRTLCDQLPPPPARFATEQGQAFLAALRAITTAGTFTDPQLAAALDVNRQTIRNWKAQRVARILRKWPGEDDIRPLRACLRLATARGRGLRRLSPEWGPVHHALMHLVHQGFEIHEIALALGTPVRKLRRFEQPPLPSPQQLSRSVIAALPRQDRDRVRPRQDT